MLEINPVSQHSESVVIEMLGILWMLSKNGFGLLNVGCKQTNKKRDYLVLMSTISRPLSGYPPLPMRQSCASMTAFILTISAYVSLEFFGLTAKQPLSSTHFSVELKRYQIELRCVPIP